MSIPSALAAPAAPLPPIPARASCLLVLFLETDLNYQTVFNVRRLEVARAVADAMGVKPCCLLPRCRGPSLCSAQRDAKERWKAMHGIQQAEESVLPPWMQEKKRKIDEKEREMKARQAALEKAAQNLCARYLLGTCPRFVEWHGKCSRRHGSVEEAKKVQCCTS